MTSFIKKRTSFMIYKIKEEDGLRDNISTMLDNINNTEIIDIKDKKLLEKTFYTQLSNINSNIVEIHDDMIAFCYRVDKKMVPESRVRARLEIEIEEKQKGSAVDLTPEEIAEMRRDIIVELGIGIYPRETTCGVIVDMKEMRVYIEKCGLSDMVEASLYTTHKIAIEPWLPVFKKPGEYESFLSWLYLSVESFRKSLNDDTEKDKGIYVDLNNSIKMSDMDSVLTLKGNIVKYQQVYKSVMHGAKVEDCELNLIDDKVKFHYGINLKTQGLFKNFECSAFPTKFKRGTEESEVVLYRGCGIRALTKHFLKFVKTYQKQVESL